MEGVLFATFLNDEKKNSALKERSIPGRGVKASVARACGRNVNDGAVHVGPSQQRV